MEEGLDEAASKELSTSKAGRERHRKVETRRVLCSKKMSVETLDRKI